MLEGILRLTFDLTYQGFTMLSIFFLYLDCRNNLNKKTAFVISLFLLFIQGGAIGFTNSIVLKVTINFAVTLGIIFAVFKNSVLQKLFLFFLYSFVQFISEAVVVVAIQLLIPIQEQPILYYQGQNLDIFAKIEAYSWSNNLGCFLTVTIATIIMYLIHIVIKQVQINLISNTLRPFLLFLFFQLPWIMIVSPINISIKNNLSIVLFLFGLSLSFSTFLWMIWQISITAQRTNAELELERFLERNQKSLSYYSNLKEKVVQVGSVRHDFNNKIEVAKSIIADGENLDTARNIISELSTRLDELDT